MAPHDTALELHKAIESKNVDSIIQIIAHYDNEHLQQVSADYAKTCGKALPEALKAVAHGEFGDLLIDLTIPRASFVAREVDKAVQGAGTDEKALIDCVVHQSNGELARIKEAYSNIFQKDLTSRIKSELSGNFGKVVQALLQGARSEGHGNPAQEAEALYKKGEGKWGTDDDFFVNFFTHHSFTDLVAIDAAYNHKYGHSLEVAVKKECSGNYEDILVALSVSRAVFWARRIRHAIAGLGTDDKLLRRAFALNTREDLKQIQAVYEAVNKGKHLRADVEGDTSGHYKTLFLALLQ